MWTKDGAKKALWKEICTGIGGVTRQSIIISRYTFYGVYALGRMRPEYRLLDCLRRGGRQDRDLWWNSGRYLFEVGMNSLLNDVEEG